MRRVLDGNWIHRCSSPFWHRHRPVTEREAARWLAEEGWVSGVCSPTVARYLEAIQRAEGLETVRSVTVRPSIDALPLLEPGDEALVCWPLESGAMGMALFRCAL